MEQKQRFQQGQMAMQQAMMGIQKQMASMPPPMPGMMPPPIPAMPTPEQIDEQIGPPQIIVLDNWINEGERRIIAGSMRIVDHDAQVDNLQLFFQTLAQPLAATPPGMKFVAGMVNEWLKLSSYSPEAQALGQQYLAELDQMMAQPPGMPPPGAPPGPPPPKPGPQPTQGAAQASKGQLQ
jgi:hypothetical protein